MSNWIKIRNNLLTHPKVVTVASRTSVTRAHAIGALCVAWMIADEHAVDGLLSGMTFDMLDAQVELPGFAMAMAEIGWLEQGEKGVVFPRYDEHNSSTAKARASASRRQEKRRKSAAVTTAVPAVKTAVPTCHAPVTHDRDTSVTRGEEKRREKNTTTPPPPAESVPARDGGGGGGGRAVNQAVTLLESLGVASESKRNEIAAGRSVAEIIAAWHASAGRPDEHRTGAMVKSLTSSARLSATTAAISAAAKAGLVRSVRLNGSPPIALTGAITHNAAGLYVDGTLAIPTDKLAIAEYAP